MEENKSSEINLFQIGVELNIIRKRINENQETYYNNFKDERHLENLLLVNYLMVDIQSLYIFMNKYLNYLVQFLHQNYFNIVNKFQQDTFASHFKKVDE